MKTSFIIDVHSFSSLITNSSSEIFIASNRDSIQTVKDILQKLLDIEKLKLGLLPSDAYRHIFSMDMFGEFTQLDFDFDPSKCELYKEYQRVHDYDKMFSHPIHIECEKTKDFEPWYDYLDSLNNQIVAWAIRSADLKYELESKELKDAIMNIKEALSWGYTFKKGNIIIQSESDNSIPFEMFDDIESIFGARRIHM